MFARHLGSYFHDKEVDDNHRDIVELTTMKLKNSKLIFRLAAFRLKFDYEIKTGRAADIICIDPGSKTHRVAHLDQSVDKDILVGLTSFNRSDLKDKFNFIHSTRNPVAYAVDVSLMPPDHEKSKFMNLSHIISFVKEMDDLLEVKFCYANEYGTSQEASKWISLMTSEENEKEKKKGVNDGLKDMIAATIILNKLLDLVISNYLIILSFSFNNLY